MTLRRFCDGCGDSISSGQDYTELTITGASGTPIEMKDWDMSCVDTGLADLMYGVTRGVYAEVRVRKTRAI